jgi:hypothetical protein
MLDAAREALSPVERELVENVERYGFHSIAVRQTEQDQVDQPRWQHVPPWTYTIGLNASLGHPDFVVFPLETEFAYPLFWDLVREIEGSRTFEPGTVYKDLLPSFPGQEFAFEPVAVEWFPALFGWFYVGDNFGVLQYLWPDRNGRFAWEDDVRAQVREAQPDLIAPPSAPGEPPQVRT